MKPKHSVDDPKGLIFEAYRMEGITKPECRTIFLDWALSLDEARDTRSRLRNLLKTYGADTAHPMTEVLSEGLPVMATPHRRGGWRSRERD
ncbi:hypothetical protein [uncultured Sulfitobacter sp.]|uniref:hypothetical protein n=1 Tax=uncultured Sulfitobacter sp. TaxID=191468 RepID=UPI00260E77D7|nr:hypothetical protein [uncultured Sulfitobacter sp.]